MINEKKNAKTTVGYDHFKQFSTTLNIQVRV